MAFAESSFSGLFIGRSTMEGTEPDPWNTMEPISHSLSTGAGSFTTDEIRSNRKPVDTVRIDTRGEGDLSFHIQMGDAAPTEEPMDMIFHAALLDTAYSAALTGTIDLDFAAAAATGVQSITGAPALTFDNASTGDVVVISNNDGAANNGIFLVVSKVSDTAIDIFNPSGVPETMDATTDLDHDGVLTIGTEKSWLWAERMFSSDASNNNYSEFFGDALVGTLDVNFRNSAPATLSISVLGDEPTLVHRDDDGPITKQRAAMSTDDPADTSRFIHGMEDVKDFYLYSAGSTTMDEPIRAINLLDQSTEFSFRLDNNLRQDFAIGDSAVANTAVGTAALSGTFTTYIDNTVTGDPLWNQTSHIAELLQENPDDLVLFFNVNDGVAGYGFYFSTVRITGAPVPIAGNNQATLLNGAWSATDMRITKYTV